MTYLKNDSVILFDGICNLCNTSVHFIIKHDKKKYFLFASLLSDAATKILLHLNQKYLKNYDSMVLVLKGKVYTKSTAALLIAKRLNGPIKLLYLFIIIPKPLRDFLYNIVAKNRYKWFGKKDGCRRPSSQTADRFL
ncbi:MAG: DCC1-like thiol-disulfide oxidoreductase family protein [Flavobacteriaceae bacterium]|nr:DCC1-like thiol-disulfide oxidoreductase family protein [Flavobacteriaceae bacterium]